MFGLQLDFGHGRIKKLIVDMANNQDFIQCSIWDKYEKKAQEIIKRLNETKDLQEKANYASGLIDAEEILLECEYFKNDDPACRVHRGIAELRRKTAEIIIKFPGAGRKQR